MEKEQNQQIHRAVTNNEWGTPPRTGGKSQNPSTFFPVSQFPISNFQILKPQGFLLHSCRARADESSMSLFSPPVRLLLILCFLGLLLGSHFGHALKLPFRVKDVLPALPRQISWPVLNNFHSAVDLLPSFVGSVSPYNGTIEWKGACFDGNEARLEFTEGDREEHLGGGVLYLKVRLVRNHYRYF